MSKFSKRAKFLSIFAAASAVGSAGAKAGATTIPGYIPPSVEAQNAAKLEKNLGLNANRNNLQIPKGPGSSIDAKSALVGGTVSGGLVGTAWLLTHLFSGKSDKPGKPNELDRCTKECLDYSIETLKNDKVYEIVFETGHGMLGIKFYSTKSVFAREMEDLVQAAVKLEDVGKLKGKEADDARLRNEKKQNEAFKKLNIGYNAFTRNIMDTLGDDLGFAVDNIGTLTFTKDKNGNILMDKKTLEQWKEEAKKNSDDNNEWKNAEMRIIEKLANNELVKDVLPAAKEKKDSQESSQGSQECPGS